MNLTFAANLTKMIDAGLGREAAPPETFVAVGRTTEYTDLGPVPIASFETNVEAPLRALSVALEPIQAGTGDPSPENVRPISGRGEVNVWREATYDPAAEPILTIQLEETVYGGTLDILRGVLTLNSEFVQLTGVETSWTKVGSGNNAYYRVARRAVTAWENLKESLCSHLRQTTISASTDNIGFSPLNSAAYGSVIGFRPDLEIYSTLAIWKEYLADQYANGTPVTVWCKTQNTNIIQLTPEQITTLIGQNNVWSDGGDVSLTYGTTRYTEGY